MKRFVYRLQTKLDIACKQEDLAKQELAARQRAYREEVVGLENLHRKREGLFVTMRKMIPPVAIEEVILRQDYLPVIKDRIHCQAERVAEAEADLNRAWARLQELMRERKTLDKLKERAWEKYRQEYQRQEQMIIDEAALIRYWRTVVEIADRSD